MLPITRRLIRRRWSPEAALRPRSLCQGEYRVKMKSRSLTAWWHGKHVFMADSGLGLPSLSKDEYRGPKNFEGSAWKRESVLWHERKKRAGNTPEARVATNVSVLVAQGDPHSSGPRACLRGAEHRRPALPRSASSRGQNAPACVGARSGRQSHSALGPIGARASLPHRR